MGTSAIDPERWAHVKAVFDELASAPPEHRASLLRIHCRDDSALRATIESLLAGDGVGPEIDGLIARALAEVIRDLDAVRTLRPGDRIGSYEITGLIGTGGMGAVYRARDTTLGRDVAIKILHANGLKQDAQQLEGEARAFAALNHPHIATIYGVFDTDGRRGIVLELVEGETLAERIATTRTHKRRGGLPVTVALNIAAQIADALEAAHERGIVHRDLKPENIKIGPDGRVKVLDFGVAGIMEADSPGQDSAYCTPEYASPEQVLGERTDRRTDVWAFGCVLYEMLAGQRALDSSTARSRPDLTRLPPDTPPALRKLVTRCLDSDRDTRLPHMSVAKFLIAEAMSAPAPSTSHRRSTTRPLLIGTIGATLLAVSAFTFLQFRNMRDTVAAGVTRTVVPVAPAEEIGGTEGRPVRTAIAVSPDGRTIVFSGLAADRRMLYVRALDRERATPLPQTEGAENPFFSPDGQWVAYWAGGAIRRVRLSGGPPEHVADAPLLAGASWDENNRILFGGVVGPLFEVAAAGGTPVPLTTLNTQRGELSHRLPHALPGGDAALFTVTRERFPRWNQTEIAAYSRRTREAKTVLDSGADARYLTTGQLVFVREGVLFGAPFRNDSLTLVDAPVALHSGVMQSAYARAQREDLGAAHFDVSRTGTMVYLSGDVVPPDERVIVSVDRSGKVEVLPLDPRPYTTLRLSPDGRQLALSTFGREREIWLFALDRGVLGKWPMTAPVGVPVWTPDGEGISYAVGGGGPERIHMARADGGGGSTPLARSRSNLVPAAWSSDGRQLLFYDIPPRTVWMTDVQHAAAPVAVVTTRNDAVLGGADLFPTGRWIAYHSNESGRFQVYVQAYPEGNPRVQVSTNGGRSPVWRADGRELFFLEPAGRNVRLIAVPVESGPTLTYGRPRTLFEGRFEINEPARGYDVSPDGRRFFFIQRRPGPPTRITQVNVVQNWHEGLTRLIPAR